jgi:tetratricopeptide (TPR) repeat protein
LSPINDTTSLNTKDIKEEEDKVNELLFLEQNAILDKALIKDPENPKYYFEKALLLFNRGYWLESLALLEKALWYIIIYYNLGIGELLYTDT